MPTLMKKTLGNVIYIVKNARQKPPNPVFSGLEYATEVADNRPMQRLLPTDGPPGETIRMLRERRGWNEQQLANHSGVHVGTISRIERNEGFTRDSLQKIAAAFAIPYQHLMIPEKLYDYHRLPPEVAERKSLEIREIAELYEYKRATATVKKTLHGLG